MRNRSPLLLILLFGLLSVTGCKTTYTHDTDESLAQSFFKIVQKKDRAGLKSLTPNMKDMLDVMEVSDVPEEAKTMIANKINDENDPLWQELQLKMDAAWEQLYQDMEAAGFDPGKARYHGYQARNVSVKPFLTADIDLQMDYEGAIYTILINDAGQVPRGWVIGGDGFKWKGRVEE
jgi:hypothetical protein